MKNLTYFLANPSKGELNVTLSNNNYVPTYTFWYPCSLTYDCTPYRIILPPGSYQIEAWGAEGGSSTSGVVGGKGGYSMVYYNQNFMTSGWAYVGGRGTDGVVNMATASPGGYHGGGLGGYSTTTTNHNSGGGGGASEVRFGLDLCGIGPIIAGGGGGGGSRTTGVAGYGGGSSGTAGTSTYPGGGGSQTAGGTSVNPQFGSTPGTMCQGGNGNTATISHSGGGGGGGYYGGGGGYVNGAAVSYIGGNGGGGSGFNKFLGNDSFGLTHMLLTGSDLIPSPEGGHEVGHSGHGAIRISVLGYYSSVHEQIVPPTHEISSSQSSSLLYLMFVSFFFFTIHYSN